MMNLGILFKPITALINRRINEQTPARELAAALEGCSMAVRVDNTALAVFLRVDSGALQLQSHYEDAPDVVLSGSPISLKTLAGSAPQQVIRDGHVTMSGDATIGQKFQQLLRLAKPDLEDALANVVGDVVANQTSTVVRGVGRAAANLSERAHHRFGDYLTTDTGALPTQEQFAAFRRDNETLRDDLARAQARVRLLAARLDEEE